MIEQPKISFIISAYNRPDYLRCLLYSLVCQTDPNWEALVMDEGGNKAVVFNDSRIKHIPVERVVLYPDGRGSLGMLPKHAGVALATGKYLCFVSEDIYYLPTFVKYMSDNTSDIVGCSVLINILYDTVILPFTPEIGGTDGCNYIIKPETYKLHPFTEYLSIETVGTADGRVPSFCVKDGATWKAVPRILAVHAEERPW